MAGEFLFFKFRSIDKRLIESLVRGELWLARPSALNDPFDCQLDLRRSFERAAANSAGSRQTALRKALAVAGLLEAWQKQFEDVGVCAFSLVSEETLLWSHYADQHRGVCLLYRFSEAFFLEPAQRILGVSTVSYDADVLTNWLQSGRLDPADTTAFVNELTKIYLTAKSPSWAHEKESRVIRLDPGPFQVPKGALVQICFGLRTPRADIELVTKLARDYAGDVSFTRMVRGDSDFAISMESL